MENYPCIDMIATGARINRIRMERGMKVTDISTYMGFEGPRAVYRWLRAESLPSLDNMCALARLLRVTVDDLVVFAGEDKKSSPVSVFYCRYPGYSIRNISGEISCRLCTLRRNLLQALACITFFSALKLSFVI